MAHLPPVMARQLSHQAAKLAKWPPHPRAEGGQVEPVLARWVGKLDSHSIEIYSLRALNA
jgi:hypothetical protein